MTALYSRRPGEGWRIRNHGDSTLAHHEPNTHLAQLLRFLQDWQKSEPQTQFRICDAPPEPFDTQEVVVASSRRLVTRFSFVTST